MLNDQPNKGMGSLPPEVLEGTIIFNDEQNHRPEKPRTSQDPAKTEGGLDGRSVLAVLGMLGAVVVTSYALNGDPGNDKELEETQPSRPIASADITIEPGGTVIGGAKGAISRIVEEAVKNGDTETAELVGGIPEDQINEAGKIAVPNSADVQPSDIYRVIINPDGTLTIEKVEEEDR